MTWGNYTAAEAPKRLWRDMEVWVVLDAQEHRIVLALLRHMYRDARAAGQRHRPANIAELAGRVKSAKPGQIIPQFALG